MYFSSHLENVQFAPSTGYNMYCYRTIVSFYREPIPFIRVIPFWPTAASAVHCILLWSVVLYIYYNVYKRLCTSTTHSCTRIESTWAAAHQVCLVGVHCRYNIIILLLYLLTMYIIYVKVLDLRLSNLDCVSVKNWDSIYRNTCTWVWYIPSGI